LSALRAGSCLQLEFVIGLVVSGQPADLYDEVLHLVEKVVQLVCQVVVALSVGLIDFSLNHALQLENALGEQLRLDVSAVAFNPSLTLLPHRRPNDV
jgi:hypothetical protein